MRRLTIFVCMAMLLSLSIMNIETASGQSGNRGSRMNFGSQGGTAASEAQGEHGNLPDRIMNLVKEGKFEEARQLAQMVLNRQESRLGPEAPEVAGSLQRLANLETLLQHWLKAITLYQRALQIREKVLGPDNPQTADTLARLGRAYTEMGAYDKALPLVERSLAIREKGLGPDALETSGSLAVLANLKRQTGAHAQALSLAQRALQIREKTLGPDHPRTAETMDLLAMIYQQQGDLEKARPLIEKAIKIKEKALGPTHPETAKSQRILGIVQQGSQDYAQAEASFHKGQSGSQGLGGMVEVCLSTGRYAQALETLETLPSRARARPQFLAQYSTQRGQALQGLGRRGEAAHAYLEAVNTIEELRARTPGERASFFQAGMVKGYYQSYLALIGLLAEMAQKGEPLPAAFRSYGQDPGAAAFYFAESIKGRALLEAMATKARTGLSKDIPPDLAAKEQQFQAKWQALLGRWDEVYSPHRGMDRDIAVYLEEQKGLGKKQADLVEELRRRAPRYAALYYPKPYTSQELPLKSGEVLLEYVLGDKESYLFRVEPGGRTQIFRLAVTRQDLEKRLGALLAPFRNPGLKREDLQRFSVAEAAALYSQLLAPALSGVSPGQHLIIVPDGVLGAFPLEALVAQQAPDWPKSVLVGDRWPVTYSQSAAILALNRHLGLSRAPKPLFALGDCIYDAGSPRYQAFKAGQGRAGELIQSQGDKALTMSAGSGRVTFPPLPETRQAVTELARLFGEAPKPPQVLLDVEATETELHRVHLNQYRYFFFGTHGFLANNLGGIKEPVLVLTQVDNKAPDNGMLTFNKVMQFQLDADLVSLAACMTGVGQVMQGEGVVNFARAFEQAGARSVMVTLWNIPVEESLKFYAVFYKSLKEGKSKLQALQAARQQVRSHEPHPYFWAGIILHGEG
ncbi:MAG: CHAT domain-containing tetratricopeptide repeat protein [Desulfobaccales bacterium]